MTKAPPDDQDVVIFGGTGDLAGRKLIPALYDLMCDGLFPGEGKIIGIGRRPMENDAFRDFANKAVERSSRCGMRDEIWRDFAARMVYVQVAGPLDYLNVRDHLQARRRLLYVATPPIAMAAIIRGIEAAGLSQDARIIVEKPFGTDLESSQRLNDLLHEVIEEQDVYRIDHYLGKETVQNLLVFRFANSVFERVWNRDAIEFLQLTVAESIGIEGRGEFYEETGALRDIAQNHLLQMLALLTMEPPAAMEPEAIRDERVKLLRSVRPVSPADVVRGQYAAGVVDGQRASGYREEPGVPPDSENETYVALRVFIDNWRWAGVPVYLRTGKRLSRRETELEVAFKPAPSLCFEGEGIAELPPNHLTHRIQPESSIRFAFLTKVPGPTFAVQPAGMQFSYDDVSRIEPDEAYELLIHDALEGDSTLFVREDAVRRSWEIVQPVLDSPPRLSSYPAGSWGPVEAEELIAPHTWHLG